MFNTDSLVANAERTTFLNLRCGWHGIGLPDPSVHSSDTISDTDKGPIEEGERQPVIMSEPVLGRAVGSTVSLSPPPQVSDPNATAARMVLLPYEPLPTVPLPAVPSFTVVGTA